MKHRLELETPSDRAVRRAVRIIVGAIAFAGIVTGATSQAVAIGPRADSASKVFVVPPAPPAQFVVPEIPSVSGVDVYNFESQLLRSSTQGWFGIGLRCSHCSIGIDDSSHVRVWDFEEAPEIQYVDPDGPAEKAGLRRGDRLTHVDGVSITSPEGGRRFGAVKPGDKARWTYVRDGKNFIATLVAGEHPDRPLLDLEVSEELEETLAKVREQQERLIEDKRISGSDHLAVESYENSVRLMQEAQRSLERARASMRRNGYLVVPKSPAPPEPQKLRYEGTIGGSEVEVHGTGSIVVRKDEHGGEELVITTPDATIHIRQKK